MSDTVPLAGDWELWRDFAVRSAGFPVSGLEVFGPAALANAVLKVASRSPTKPPSKARGREVRMAAVDGSTSPAIA